MSAEFLDGARRRSSTSTPPREARLRHRATRIKAMHAGQGEGLRRAGRQLPVGRRPTPSTPPRRSRRCALTVHVSTKLNRAHLDHRRAGADPAVPRPHRARRAERRRAVRHRRELDGRRAHVARRAAAGLASTCCSEPAIVAGIARATLGDSTTVDWEALVDDYDRIRDHIEHVVPGFDAVQRARAPARRLLPAERAARQGSSRRRSQARAASPCIRSRSTTLEPGQLLMMTIRSHDQFNTTIYGVDDRYRGIHGGRRVDLHERRRHRERWASAAASGSTSTSHFDGETRRAERFIVVPYDIPRGCAAAYFPGDQRAGADPERGRREQPAGVEVDGDHARAVGDRGVIGPPHANP